MWDLRGGKYCVALISGVEAGDNSSRFEWQCCLAGVFKILFYDEMGAGEGVSGSASVYGKVEENIVV